MKEYKVEDVMEFLRESNAIEGIYDEDSLKQAKRAWDYIIKQDKLDEDVIQKMHKTLMLHQVLRKDEIGFFRRCAVWIGGRQGLDFTLIMEAIKHWVSNANDLVKNGKKENHTYLEGVIKIQHVAYEKIHPFVDGNGRTGRLLINWSRFKLELPILIIHEGDEQMDYYKWFR